MLTDAEINEIVGQLQKDIQKQLEESLIGVNMDSGQILQQAIKFATDTMNKRLPGFKASAINPRYEGNLIVWDGWLLKANE